MNLITKILNVENNITISYNLRMQHNIDSEIQQPHLRKMGLSDLEMLRINKNKNKDYFFLQEDISESQQMQWYEFMMTQTDNVMFMCIDNNGESFGCIGYRKLENVIDIYNVIRFKPSEITMSECIKNLISGILKKYVNVPIQVLVLDNNPAIKWYEKNDFTIVEHKNNFVKMILNND